MLDYSINFEEYVNPIIRVTRDGLPLFAFVASDFRSAGTKEWLDLMFEDREGGREVYYSIALELKARGLV
jgi:hypothetical protein